MKWIGIVLAVLVMAGALMFVVSQQVRVPKQCVGFEDVGTFDQEIETEQEALDVALDYYASVGAELSVEDIDSLTRTATGWRVRVDVMELLSASRARGDVLSVPCAGHADPPACFGRELMLDVRQNTIGMSYTESC